MKLKRQKKKSRFITTYIISGGFLLLILLGTVLLHLPWASSTGVCVPWSDALFTATTSVCVTGLVTVPTYCTWSYFGQAVILILIQLGGLGVISFTILFLQLLGKKIGLRESQLIKDAYNLDKNNGMDILVRKIFVGTFIVEGIGALFYSFVFVPEYGISGIWKSIFNSVSAFCNAGMDILGPSSLVSYQSNIAVNLITMALIILGGIGFPIWFLTIDKIKEYKKGDISLKRLIRSLPLSAKAVLTVTAILILSGAVLIFALEYSNKETIGTLPLGDKILTSLFQSVTTRTAGFCSISQSGLRRSTIIICCVLMFIGGSPSGTAGGIKTTTFLILAASMFSAVSGRDHTEVFKRKINADTVRKAMSIFTLNLLVFVISLLVFCIVQPSSFENCIYEVVSAIGTVGLSRDLTPSLNLAGKIVIIVTMYLGRIGPISLALFFNTKKYVNLIQYPEENISIG